MECRKSGNAFTMPQADTSFHNWVEVLLSAWATSKPGSEAHCHSSRLHIILCLHHSLSQKWIGHLDLVQPPGDFLADGPGTERTHKLPQAHAKLSRSGTKQKNNAQLSVFSHKKCLSGSMPVWSQALEKTVIGQEASKTTQVRPHVKAQEGNNTNNKKLKQTA